MPTENRSSNTEMVSVPEGYMLVERSIWTEQQVEAATTCITRLKGVHGMRDRDLAMAAIDAAQCKAPDISLADLQPAEQHQGEPGEVERLRAALKFYANREHYHFESGNWDTVSGEPLNILWCGDEPDFIENGSVARAALSASAEPSKIGNPELSASTAPAASIPDGYCLMPRRLTAENGAKALLLGEFKLQVTRECPECLDLEEPAEGCEICDGEGEYAQRHTIPWDQIKFIYSEAVKGLALQSPVAMGESQMTFEYVHPDGERRSVSMSRAEVAEHMDSELFEKLTDTICQCEPIGETNVVDCRCDEVAEQFELVKP